MDVGGGGGCDAVLVEVAKYGFEVVALWAVVDDEGLEHFVDKVGRRHGGDELVGFAGDGFFWTATARGGFADKLFPEGGVGQVVGERGRWEVDEGFGDEEEGGEVGLKKGENCELISKFWYNLDV